MCHILNYEEAIKYVENCNKFGIKLGLQNMQKLLQGIDNPQKYLKFIHVAGTNGKGSTCSMIAEVLITQGYNVGLYSSPYLQAINEAIRINGINISDKCFANILTRVKDAALKIQLEEPLFEFTEYEIMTTAAFLFFKLEQVDFVVLEVGMGGRLDATNIIEAPILSVLTPITMDHVQYLGDTIEKIAKEKCGIIKKNSMIVTAKQDKAVYNIISKVSAEQNSRFIKATEACIESISHSIDGQVISFKYKEIEITFKLKLLGEYQLINCQTALVALMALKHLGIRIDKENIVRAMENVKWPGRFEVVHKEPVVILDGAHNVDAMKVLAASLKKYFSGHRIFLVLGILKDKDYKEMVSIIAPKVNEVILTEPQNNRKLEVQDLKEVVIKYNSNIVACSDCFEAVKIAMSKANAGDIICVAGSLYLTGIIRGLFYDSFGRNERI